MAMVPSTRFIVTPLSIIVALTNIPFIQVQEQNKKLALVMG